MSIDALRWAFAQPIGNASRKFVLVALANRTNLSHDAYPSLVQLGLDTGLNRKTIMSALDWLQSRGYINDTGQRKGSSRRVKVFRLVAAADSTKNGTVPISGSSRFCPEIVPFLPTGQYQKRYSEPTGNPKGTHKGVRARKAKVFLPDAFGISDQVRQWAQQNNYGDLEAHLEAFKCKAQAKAYKYADWDAAFMNAIREDWAHVRNRDERQPGNGRGSPDRWCLTHEGIDRKGRELGMTARPTESYEEFKQRIFERLRSADR
jgi:hypothetical protein